MTFDVDASIAASKRRLGLLDDEKLLASAMRKLLTDEAIYIDLCPESCCVDGWIENLTPEEVAAMRAVLDETNE